MIEEKDYFVGKRFAIGVACCQGNRRSMQDAYSAVLSNRMDNECDFFAVFDGHGMGGELQSHFVANRLCDAVLERVLGVRWSDDNVLLARVIQNAFIDLDEEMRTEECLMSEKGRVKGGTTACAIWARRNKLYLAHVGDTRAVLCTGGCAHQLTEDHVPCLKREAKRICKAGGCVERNRIEGALAVSRAFGNYQFKSKGGLCSRSQMVTACPDVRVVDVEKDLRGKNFDFIVIASDGAYESFSNQNLVQFVEKELIKIRFQNLCDRPGARNLDDVAVDVVRKCLSPSDFTSDHKKDQKSEKTCPASKDNVTVMIAVPVHN